MPPAAGRSVSQVLHLAIPMPKHVSLFFAALLLVCGSSRTLAAPPPNDAFADAAVIPSVLPASVTGSNIDATREADEPEHSWSDGKATVWWKWTASATARVLVSTADSSFDTVLAVYAGPAVSELEELASNDDAGSGHTSALTFDAIAGTTYFLAVAGYDDRDQGAITLALNEIVPPANDNFANAQALPSGVPFSVPGSLVGSAREPGETDWITQSVWYRWTPTVSGRVQFGLSGNASVESYTGDSLEGLVGQVGGRIFVLPVEAGTTYYFQVFSYWPTVESFDLKARPAPPAPPNDEFDQATVLAGEPPVASGYVAGARDDYDLDEDLWDPVVWFRWTAPASGVRNVVLRFEQSEDWGFFHVFTGSADALNSVGGRRYDGDAVRLEVTGGVTYYFAVGGDLDDLGDGNFTLTLWAPPANDHFAQSAVVPAGSPAQVTGWNVAASQEPGEPGPDPRGPVKSRNASTVWWKWTAPDTLLWEAGTAGSDYDTTLEVWTGDSLASLVPVASSDNDGASTGDSGKAPFFPTAGRTYYFRVAGPYRRSLGRITLTLTRVPAPSSVADYLRHGRAALAANTDAGLDRADDYFAAALALSPNDPTANVFRALTRLGRLQHQPGFTSFLAQWGLQPVRSSLRSARYEFPRDGAGRRVAAASADAAQFSAWLNATVLPELTAFDTALQKADVAGLLAPLEDGVAGRWTVIDRADVQIMRAAAHLLRAFIHFNNTYNTDGSIQALLDLEHTRQLNAEKILGALPDLLKKRPADQRNEFKAAVKLANQFYQSGVLLAEAREGGLGISEYLTYVRRNQAKREPRLRAGLAAAAGAFDGPTLWEEHTVDFRPLLTTGQDYRTLLPRFKGNQVIAGSTPDPTFLGSLPSGTQAVINKFFKDRGLLYEAGSFLAWVQSRLAGRPAAEQTATADPDRDGLTNLEEYVFSLDPVQANGSEEYQAAGLVAQGEARYFTLTFVRLANLTDAKVEVEVSDTFTSWDATQAQIEAVGPPVANPDGVTETVTYRLKLPVSATAWKFLRLKVTALP